MSAPKIDLTGLSEKGVEQVRRSAEAIRQAEATAEALAKEPMEEWLKRFHAWVGRRQPEVAVGVPERDRSRTDMSTYPSTLDLTGVPDVFREALEHLVYVIRLNAPREPVPLYAVNGMPFPEWREQFFKWVREYCGGRILDDSRYAIYDADGSGYPEGLSPQEKADRFRAWAGRYPGGPHVDDSRESIYTEGVQ
jgi:hypothetical protein